MLEKLRQEIIARVDAKLADGYELTPKVFFSRIDRCGCLVGLAMERGEHVTKRTLALQLAIMAHEEHALEAGFCDWGSDAFEAQMDFYELGRELRRHYETRISTKNYV